MIKICKIRIKGKKNVLGMTLIEVIVALAIIGIIAAGIIPIFSNGIKLLVRNGSQMKDMYIRQNNIEEKISKGSQSGTTNMKIIFSGKTIDIMGENVTKDAYNLFVPNPNKVIP